MGLCTSSSAASPVRNKEKGWKGSGGGGGIVACGKRTDFGYDKDFEARYALGKLLGHGQFGYTFAAVNRHSDESVAVKRIDKNKSDSVSPPAGSINCDLLDPVAIGS
ncbi:calcium-dependent protein kinase 28 [Hordeum vulgare]|nr:calcium-dependent protein kinase 28 [Hordeum vulgare]